MENWDRSGFNCSSAVHFDIAGAGYWKSVNAPSPVLGPPAESRMWNGTNSATDRQKGPDARAIPARQPGYGLLAA